MFNSKSTVIRCMGRALVASLQVIAISSVAVTMLFVEPVAAALLVYYPFDTSANDASGGSDHATLGGTATISSEGPMFGAGSLAQSSTTGNATVADGAADLDRTYQNFSVSLWLKPTNWAAGGTQYVAGKNTGSLGWRIFKNTTQLTIQAWGNGTGNGIALDRATQIDGINGVPLTDYVNYVATFSGRTSLSDPNHTVIRTYINGIFQASLDITAQPETAPPSANSQLIIDATNGAPFQVGNRGSTNNGLVGNIDDFALWDDVRTDLQVAVTHGLGRLAGISLGAGATPSAEILGVLNAYNTQGSAVAGGQTWEYAANLNKGTTIGMAGGTVAGDDAYIVLGSDGSGVLLQSAPAVPGDFDSDGDVDGADFVAWQTNFPKATEATLGQGDADHDGDVDGADFVVWQTNFPFTPGGGSAVVPEPASVILALCGIVLLALRRM